MNTETPSSGRPLSLCSSYRCTVRETCRRYLAFKALPRGGSVGRWFVACSGTLGARCQRYVPADEPEPEKDTEIQQ